MTKRFIFLVISLLVLPVWANSPSAVRSFKIQGDGFGSATQVLLDDAPVSFKIVNDHEIVIDPPKSDKASSRIAVVTPAGRAEFTYATPIQIKEQITPLALASVSPASGSTLGGQELTVMGAGFRRKELVLTIGGKIIKSPHINGDRMLTVTLPPHEPGTVDLEVLADGKVETLKQAFTYVAPPAIQKVTPGLGTVAGGTVITLEGSNFAIQGPVRVLVGRVEASDVRIMNGQSLSAKTPAGMEGSMDITVINPDGQEGILKGAYLYMTQPQIKAAGPIN